MHRLLLVGLLLCSISALAGNRSRKNIPPAPLPTVVTNAKKIFLVNDGGSDLAYDAFYSAMKSWERYTIVGTPDDADVIMELAYQVKHGGTITSATSNGWAMRNRNTTTYNGGTHFYTIEIPDPQLALTIYDAKSKQLVWSATDHRRLARREKNREKEIINSAERLVDELKARVSAP